MTVTVGVLNADIARVPSDAIITAINSAGFWGGDLDAVIQEVAGNRFHIQASRSMPLSDGQTIVARSDSPHDGAFGDVVFVVDDLRRRLSYIILAGLQAADHAGYKHVALPAMRLGIMLGVIEQSKQETLNQISEGVRSFIAGEPVSIEKITVVVYSDDYSASRLRQALGLNDPDTV